MRQSACPAVKERHFHNAIGLEKPTEEQVPYTADDGTDDVKQKVDDACEQDNNDNSKHNYFNFKSSLINWTISFITYFGSKPSPDG